MAYRIVLRQDTAANWTSNNPTLLSGEFGFETNTNRLKLGDGVRPWTTLEYFQSGPTGEVAYDYSGSTGYFYVCVTTNTWMRTTLTTF